MEHLCKLQLLNHCYFYCGKGFVHELKLLYTCYASPADTPPPAHRNGAFLGGSPLTTTMKRLGLFLAAMVLAVGLTAFDTAANPEPAHAAAQTCTSAPQGSMCTATTGSGLRVNNLSSSRIKFTVGPPVRPISMCNTSAYFFYYQPGKPAVSLGTMYRAGCVYTGRAYFTKAINRSFPAGTQVCTKFYENNWENFSGQRCVGIKK
ncbi:MAG TPA: hypothetical protein VK694_08030 [Verrucomicrobiae bacterium]|nr:hypothetical protein [Verrucomicrobiae bacterium]